MTVQSDYRLFSSQRSQWLRLSENFRSDMINYGFSAQ